MMAAFPGIYENRDGTEEISKMWIEDKRKLCLILDARNHWKDLGWFYIFYINA